MASLALSSVAGCSSSTSSAPVATSDAALKPFAKYCTGTLKADQPLMKSAGSGSWIGDGSSHAASGTVLLLSPSFHGWSGYVVQTDGTAMKVDGDFDTGLVKDKDFTSDCVGTAAPDQFGGRPVVLRTSPVYDNDKLTGAACMLDVGTELTNYQFVSAGIGSSSGPATISAVEIKAKCGFDVAYSKDFEYGELVSR